MTKLNIGLFVLNLIFLGLYLPLNTPRSPMFNLETEIDKYIPLIPFFVIPYLSFYIFLFFTIFSLRNSKYVKNLYATLVSSFLTILISYLVYTAFQTHVIRPPIASDNFFLMILSYLYYIDNPYNGFPSIHASLSTIGALTWINRQSKYSKIFITWAAVIIISTLLTKQHYILDIFGGTLLATFSYLICNRLNLFGKNF